MSLPAFDLVGGVRDPKTGERTRRVLRAHVRRAEPETGARRGGCLAPIVRCVAADADVDSGRKRIRTGLPGGGSASGVAAGASGTRASARRIRRRARVAEDAGAVRRDGGRIPRRVVVAAGVSPRVCLVPRIATGIDETTGAWRGATTIPSRTIRIATRTRTKKKIKRVAGYRDEEDASRTRFARRAASARRLASATSTSTTTRRRRRGRGRGRRWTRRRKGKEEENGNTTKNVPRRRRTTPRPPRNGPRRNGVVNRRVPRRSQPTRLGARTRALASRTISPNRPRCYPRSSPRFFARRRGVSSRASSMLPASDPRAIRRRVPPPLRHRGGARARARGTRRRRSSTRSREGRFRFFSIATSRFSGRRSARCFSRRPST